MQIERSASGTVRTIGGRPGPHDGALAKQIKSITTIMILAGCGVTVLMVIILFLHGLPAATEEVKSGMTEIETTFLRRMAEDKATFTTEVLSRVVTDITLLQSFAQARLEGAAPAAGLAHKSFAGVGAQGFDTDRQPKDNSVYYLPGRTSAAEAYGGASADADTEALLDKIAPLDMAFRAISKHYGSQGSECKVSPCVPLPAVR